MNYCSNSRRHVSWLAGFFLFLDVSFREYDRKTFQISHMTDSCSSLLLSIQMLMCVEWNLLCKGSIKFLHALLIIR